MSKNKAPKVRKKPRISLNKLGEYLTAKTGRRKTIVKDQKYPKPWKDSRYLEAKASIIGFFVQTQTGSEEGVLQLIDDLEGRVIENDFKNQDRDLSIELLNNFLDTVEELDFSHLKKCKFIRAPRKKASLQIEEVEVSVSPDVIIRATNNRNQSIIGAIKVATSKSTPMSKETGEYITTTLHQYLESEVVSEKEIINRDLCILIDIPQNEIFTAPKSFKKRRKDIKAACQEIKLWWGAI